MSRRQRDDVATTSSVVRFDRPPLQVSSNELFVKYYRDVNPIILPAAASSAVAPDSEVVDATSGGCWNSFVEYLEKPLRQTFWINDTDPLAAVFAKELEQIGGTNVEPIPWYPSFPFPGHSMKLGWRVTASKESFRHAKEVQPLRQLMIRLTALGIISRQEEVSMIPPLLLEIKANDKCLDMCAAPGSKTAQMLCALGRSHLLQSHNAASTSPSSVLPFDYINSTGLVMANEIDEKRSNMLVHQCKRIRSLFPFAVFTNHDARYLPNIIASSSSPSPQQDQQTAEYFDKVLCDVMCSGDGTLRKAPALLRSWRPFDAVQLQKSQVQVALRGCHLLKVGGRLVYSTCSLNPIENEAVVSQILLRTNGALKLIDPRPILPGLKCDPGMKTWTVMRNDGSIVTEGPDSKLQSQTQPQQLHPALFPVEGADFPLERCMRLMPHHCEGGGFFVAVFEKVQPWQIVTVAELQRINRISSNNNNNNNNDEQVQQVQQQQLAGDEVDQDHNNNNNVASEEKKKFTLIPLLPFATPEKELIDKEIVDNLTLNESILPRANLVSRHINNHIINNSSLSSTSPSSEMMKASGEKGEQQQTAANQTAPIQFVSSGVRNLIREGVRNPQLRISACGLRTLLPQPGLGGQLGWRISHEASDIIAPALDQVKKVVRATLDDVLPMINEESGSRLKDVTFENIKNEEFRKKVEEDLSIGCFLLKISSPFRPEMEVVCSALRARNRIQLLVDAEDMQGLRCRLGIELEKQQPQTETGVNDE